jgi:prophage tail gpP-like protein
MPTPINEYAEVRANSGIYRDWTSVSVRWSYEALQGPIFTLTLAEPDPKSLKLAPGDDVDIIIGDKPVIQKGFIKVRQAAYDAQTHAVRIDGFTRLGPATEVSVDRKDVQFQGYKFEAIAQRLLKPLGVSFKMQKPPPEASAPFGNVIIYRGERIAEAIERLARQRAIWLVGDVDGTLLGGDPQGGGSTDLVEGENILSCNCYLEQPGADAFWLDLQGAGNDSTFGRKAAEVSAKGTIEGGRKGLQITEVGEEPGTQTDAKARVRATIRDISKATLRVTITHNGWFKPGTQDLWKPGDSVTVRSPMAFPSGNETMSLKVWAITWHQSAAGTLTTVELVNEATFGGGASRSDQPTFPSGPTQEPEMVPPP